MIVILLITNILLILFFVVLDKPAARSGRGRNPNGLATMLKNDVHFSPNQLGEYYDLRRRQLDSIHRMFDGLRASRMEFYDHLFTGHLSDSALEAQAGDLAQKQKTLDLYMFHHFMMLRDICTPEQLPLFDTTLRKVLVRMTGRIGHGPHNPNRR
ncbi:MAG: hypothetical protein KGM98_12115 [Bacteroidota bacterium]|nr:hypothetical protein [Bacteroidota bacterium]